MSSLPARPPHDGTLDPPRLRSGARGASECEAWELATADGGDRARCAAFLDRLDAMPRADWLEVGRGLLAADAAAGRRAAASAALDRVLAARGLRVTAWLVSDRVETAVHVAASGGASRAGAPRSRPPCSPAERLPLAAARGAAERAALAHLAGPWLAPADHLTLILPFLTLVHDERE